ncbi:hypothetical protein ACTHOQ_15945 [Solibacillus silvestris]
MVRYPKTNLMPLPNDEEIINIAVDDMDRWENDGGRIFDGAHGSSHD